MSKVSRIALFLFLSFSALHVSTLVHLRVAGASTDQRGSAKSDENARAAIEASLDHSFGSNKAAQAVDLPAPQMWQPGIISSSLDDAAPAFTPDGKTVYFGRSFGGGGKPVPTIYVSHLNKGRWTPSKVAPFSGRFHDMEPAMSPDGSHMVFISNRPAQPGGKLLDGFYNKRAWPEGGGALWRVDHQGESWGEPYRLPDSLNSSSSTFAPAVAGDSSLYFMRPSEMNGRFQLFRSQYARGAYQPPQPLPFSNGEGEFSDVDPAVSPDESFIVFGSGRPPAKGMDIFVVFKRPDGVWGRPVHLGDKLNAPGSDAESRLSPDGKTLYFSSERVAPDAPRNPDGLNNGKYNIWFVKLDPAIWRALRARSIYPA